MSDAGKPLLRVTGLSKRFPVRGGLFGRVREEVRAVDSVSFDLAPGETLALVGESGCGKTTVGRCVLRLLAPSSGSIRFAGRDLASCSHAELRGMRQRMQMIFQDPYSSLNPRMTVGQMLAEPLRAHRGLDSRSIAQALPPVLQQVGLDVAYLDRYPHEFSGGQRQRIGIARALVLEPELIVCDEAVSALDVSIQAQIVNLLSELQQQRGLAYLFITHDLNVVSYLADRVAVMYLGRIVEQGPTAELFDRPAHPYTRALIQANPVADPQAERGPEVVEGDVPSPLNPPTGCHFHPRCPRADSLCAKQAPATESRGPDRSRSVACHHPLN